MWPCWRRRGGASDESQNYIRRCKRGNERIINVIMERQWESEVVRAQNQWESPAWRWQWRLSLDHNFSRRTVPLSMIFENLSMRRFVRTLYLGSLDAALIILSSSSDMTFLIFIIRNQVRDLAWLRDAHSILFDGVSVTSWVVTVTMCHAQRDDSHESLREVAARSAHMSVENRTNVTLNSVHSLTGDANSYR